MLAIIRLVLAIPKALAVTVAMLLDVHEELLIGSKSQIIYICFCHSEMWH